MGEQAKITELTGTVERIVFVNPENAWTVARLRVEKRDDPVTVVGSLPGVTEGLSLRVAGQWVKDARYGEQLKIARFNALTPTTLEGIERYLGSGAIPGVGPAFAARIVGRFGLQTLQVLDETPARLREIPGVGKARAAKLVAAWAEQRGAREVLIFLEGHGVSPTLANRILRTYGSAAPRLVRENPYRLALDVAGIGFRIADEIAKGLGVARDSPQRAAAGLLHLLGERVVAGHTAYPCADLLQETAALLEIPPTALEPALQLLGAEGHVFIEPTEGIGSCAAPAALHRAEVEAASRLLQLAREPVPLLEIDIPRATAWVEAEQSITLGSEQRAALSAALREKVLVITGGPGVGKTTLVRSILAVLEKKGRTARLAAPTGRAAKRLSEATGKPAQTLHRLLEFSPKNQSFQRDRETPLEAELLVVDEMSMVDTLLFHHLLMAVPLSCQLILVGDADQLPSIGAGSVLRDLLASHAVPAIRLNEIYRQVAKSRIVQNAHRVNRGLMPEWGSSDEESDFYFLERELATEAAAVVCELVASRLPKRYGLDPFRDIQVLTPMHRGEVGATALNASLQAALNPEGKSFARGGAFRLGDKVMQLRNNYDKEVFNGDIGRLTALDGDVARVEFDGREVSYDVPELDELTLAYACSVHKAQGSEYPAVVLPLLTQHYPLLQRNLLYTALTRGKRLVVVVGSRRALALAVKNERTQGRYTRLAQRLSQAKA